jgi:lipopolysaccharide/colanic/teichoic acid biosynthesis glycosyltransferase
MISSPLMLLSVLLILIFDGGPVIFRQKRLTIGGREFYIFKFRSMVRNAESECGARLCSINDMRVTKIGRVLRVLRFDELPQLFNILRGDMSLVGPRPERPEIAAEYKKYIPEFDFRLKVKAGLTGYAQVFGKYNTTPYDKLKLDLMYISAYSLVEDFKLMMMTAKIIFIRESTEGVDGDLLPGDTPLPGPEAEIGIIDPPETSKTGDGR